MLENALGIDFQNTFARDLKGLYRESSSSKYPSSEILLLNDSLASELGIKLKNLHSKDGVDIFSGNKKHLNSITLAQAYSGHQFGRFNPNLGDGRALLLGEVLNKKGELKDIQLKGSGPTPFSRRGDGKSALGPVLREYLISESMNALNIPTTRALAAVKTGEQVERETYLPGGIMTRVASSHIRIGTYEYASLQNDNELIKRLADYSISRHFPDTGNVENPYLALFAAICNQQASLIANWRSIGFIHGVMNTDNMSISGETIDYGPCAFMNTYNPETVFSSIDVQGRYAFQNQPSILTWNLTRLAETFIPLVDNNKDESVKLLTEVLQLIKPVYTNYWLSIMRSKIGLSKEEHNDIELIAQFLEIMAEEKADFTLSFRMLSKALIGDKSKIKKLFSNSRRLDGWIMLWQERVSQENIAVETIANSMDKINPLYIPRNHKVEEALDEAVFKNNMRSFNIMLSVMQNPYDEIESNKSFAEAPISQDKSYKTFCGT